MSTAARPRTVLLTGFEPFDGADRNPSIEAVRLAERAWDRPEALVAQELPVAYGRAGVLVEQLMTVHEPAVVLGVGLAAGRARIGLERLAVNLCDARIPDNDGARPADEPVVPGGPTAFLATVPVKSALRRLLDAGIDAEVSMTAGTYVCNAVFYRSALLAAGRGDVRAGFVHVPGGVPVETLARAVRLVADAALDVVVDAAVPHGATS
nr:pyroglutamyl-peptidase I [uncultured Actinotalea sp.]